MSIKPKFLIACLVFMILGFVIGVCLPSSDNTDDKNQEVRDQNDGYQYINPLLECNNASFSNDKNLNSLKISVQTYLDSQINSKTISFASVYYRDLNNGPWFGINEKENFSPSSLIKVPLMITYYKLAEDDPTILQKVITNDIVPEPSIQTILPKVTLTPNQSYTVNELINQMIIYSDNHAYDLLLKNIDNNLIFEVYQDMGIDIRQANSNNPNGNIISVKDYASFFRILFNSSYLTKYYSENALKLLTQIDFKSGIPAGIDDKKIEISHKFGERYYEDINERQLHDCGIVYLPQKPYLLCIMSRGQNIDNLTSTIKHISSMIFTEINSR
jgi:beta-lactamase class A